MLINQFIAVGLYFSLVTGGVLPIYTLGPSYMIARLLVLIATFVAVMVARPSGKLVRNLGCFFLLASVLVCLTSFYIPDMEYALKKADGLIFGTLTSSLILYALFDRLRFYDALRHIVNVGMLFLSLTVLYKARYGLWDRTVNFMLNGPIVFGWLMGMMALFALLLFYGVGAKSYLIKFAIFFVSVLWTESKGPLVCLIAVAGSQVAYRSWKSKKFSLGIVTALLVFLVSMAVFSSFISRVSEMGDSRLSAISRLSSNKLDESDQGSVGERSEMLEKSLKIISRHPFAGVGFGGWQTAVASDHKYPHNVTLEIFSECGGIIGLIFLVSFALIWRKASHEMKLVALFFILSNSFSGDASYLRFPLTFLLVSVSSSGKQRDA